MQFKRKTWYQWNHRYLHMWGYHLIFTTVRISYCFYQFVTTRYTTDFYIIKPHVLTRYISNTTPAISRISTRVDNRHFGQEHWSWPHGLFLHACQSTGKTNTPFIMIIRKSGLISVCIKITTVKKHRPKTSRRPEHKPWNIMEGNKIYFYPIFIFIETMIVLVSTNTKNNNHNQINK